MTILGLDPGIARMGWAIVVNEKSEVKSLAYGCIETSSKKSQEKRLQELYSEVSSLIESYHPDSLAIEQLYFGNNSKTAFVVGEARGVALLASAIGNISVNVYNPMEVKIALTGYGSSDKRQVANMVKIILKLEKLPKLDDTTDALAIALTHAFSSKIKKLKL